MKTNRIIPLDFRKTVLLLKSELEINKENYKTALDLKDSIHEIDHEIYNELVFEAQEKYKSEIKERQYEKEKVEHENTKVQLRNNVLLLVLFSLVFVFSLASLLYYNYLQKVKRSKDQIILDQKNNLVKQQALQNERNRIAAEMHDDLGGGLTSIKYLSQKAINNNTSGSDKEHLEKIMNHSQTLVSNMSEIIWAMNTGNDTLENLIGYIRRYSHEYLEEHDISLSFKTNKIPADQRFSGTQRRNVFLVVKEALHNIAKHSEANQVECFIEFKDSLNIIIRDNGIGIKNESRGHGLNNMKKRIESLHGIISISNTNPGTEIKLTIPLNQ